MKSFRAFVVELEEKKLVGGQKELDHDKDGDIDGSDFAMMRKKKKNEDTDQLDELSPATLGNYVNKVNDKVANTGYGKKRSQRQKGLKTALNKLVTKAGGDKNDVTNY